MKVHIFIIIQTTTPTTNISSDTSEIYSNKSEGTKTAFVVAFEGNLKKVEKDHPFDSVRFGSVRFGPVRCGFD